jgi:hypothetical protein
MLLAAVLPAALTAGCSSASTTPATTATQSTIATAARHHAVPPHRRSRPRAPSPIAGLPVSRVSSTVVQSQPAPGSCHARESGLFSLPDPRCTPGALSPAVTQSDLGSTICSEGYTDTVRPPEPISESEKEASLAAYGDAGPLHIYEYDHLVPLELGGAPNDPRNLWPEPGRTPNPKDELERRLRGMVCAGELPLGTAQREIASDWVVAYRRVIR